MFKLPRNVAKDVLTGKIDPRDLPYFVPNQQVKYILSDEQARVNSALEKEHWPYCTALEKDCTKKGCLFYSAKNTGPEESWACMEYLVDFPSAPFDERFHVVFVGTDSEDVPRTIDNIKYLTSQGAKYFCLSCKKTYENPPVDPFVSSQENNLCICGSNTLYSIDSVISALEKRVEPCLR